LPFLPFGHCKFALAEDFQEIVFGVTTRRAAHLFEYCRPGSSTGIASAPRTARWGEVAQLGFDSECLVLFVLGENKDSIGIAGINAAAADAVDCFFIALQVSNARFSLPVLGWAHEITANFRMIEWAAGIRNV
jgi:hypothetical protein